MARLKLAQCFAAPAGAAARPCADPLGGRAQLSPVLLYSWTRLAARAGICEMSHYWPVNRNLFLDQARQIAPATIRKVPYYSPVNSNLFLDQEPCISDSSRQSSRPNTQECLPLSTFVYPYLLFVYAILLFADLRASKPSLTSSPFVNFCQCYGPRVRARQDLDP